MFLIIVFDMNLNDVSGLIQNSMEILEMVQFIPENRVMTL